MVIELQALVVRIDNKVVAYQGLDDHYTSSQLFIKDQELESQGVDFWKHVAKTSWWAMSDSGLTIREQEAKDQCVDLENFKISIETFSIDTDLKKER